jgi:hypothetical protein
MNYQQLEYRENEKKTVTLLLAVKRAVYLLGPTKTPGKTPGKHTVCDTGKRAQARGVVARWGAAG